MTSSDCFFSLNQQPKEITIFILKKTDETIERDAIKYLAFLHPKITFTSIYENNHLLDGLIVKAIVNQQHQKYHLIKTEQM